MRLDFWLPSCCRAQHTSPSTLGMLRVTVQQFQVPCGVHITENLSLTLHTDTMVKNACQWLCFLRRLRKSSVNASTLTNSRAWWQAASWSGTGTVLPTAAESDGSTAHHWQQTSGHSGWVKHAVPAEGTKHHQGPRPPITPPVTIWRRIQEHRCSYRQT